MSNESISNDANSTPHFTGIKSFIQRSNLINNGLLILKGKSFEPLPFMDYSLFEDTYNSDKLLINVNPFASSINKKVFLPNVPLKVTVATRDKDASSFLQYFRPYIYILSFEHGPFSWKVARTYNEIKEVHKSLAKFVKREMGKSCSDFLEEEIKQEWPIFETDNEKMLSFTKINKRCQMIQEYLTKMLTYPPFRNHPSVLNLLNVSPLSFVTELGSSILEGSLQKR